jgi:hypothetical protein
MGLGEAGTSMCGFVGGSLEGKVWRAEEGWWGEAVSKRYEGMVRSQQAPFCCSRPDMSGIARPPVPPAFPNAAPADAVELPILPELSESV